MNQFNLVIFSSFSSFNLFMFNSIYSCSIQFIQFIQFIHSCSIQFIHVQFNSFNLFIHVQFNSFMFNSIHSIQFIHAQFNSFIHSISFTHFESLPKIGIDLYLLQSTASTPADPQTKTAATPSFPVSFGPIFLPSPFDPTAPTVRFVRSFQSVQIAPRAPAETNSAKTAAASGSRAFHTPTPGSFAWCATCPNDRNTIPTWEFHSGPDSKWPQRSPGVSPDLENRGDFQGRRSRLTEFPAFFGNIRPGRQRGKAKNRGGSRRRFRREFRRSREHWQNLGGFWLQENRGNC